MLLPIYDAVLIVQMRAFSLAAMPWGRWASVKEGILPGKLLIMDTYYMLYVLRIHCEVLCRSIEQKDGHT